MGLDVNSLGELLRKERASPSLQEVSETFYSDLRELLKEVEEKYPQYSRERDNLKNLVTDIYNNREKKLVLFAISYARSEEEGDLDNATPEEKEFFESLVSMLKERRMSLREKKEKNGKTKASAPQKKPDKLTAEDEKKRKDSETITLRILQDLPPIVGADGKTYGAFKTEDIVALPEKNAKIFLKHGYAENIDVT